MKEIKSAILNSDIDLLQELLQKQSIASKSEHEEIIVLSKRKGNRMIEAILIVNLKERLDFYNLIERKNLIVGLITEISQDIYASSWNAGIESDLWNWGNEKEKPVELFQTEINLEYAKLVVDLGKKMNLWASWSENDQEPKAISLLEWIKTI